MQIIKRISVLLANGKVQRVCYFLALIYWIAIWKDFFSIYNSTSFLGIKYIWLITIPATLLVVQIIFNKRFTWALIFALITIFTLVAIITTTIDLVERSGDHVKAIHWDLKEVLI